MYPRGRIPRPRAERFWAKVYKNGPVPQHIPELGPCWLWTAYISEGYGEFESTTAHRTAWELTYGPIPLGFDVLHRCDNRTCVRPAHLFLGTDLDNARDREAKGRGRHGQRKVIG
jgi:hypothetical protein